MLRKYTRLKLNILHYIDDTVSFAESSKELEQIMLKLENETRGKS